MAATAKRGNSIRQSTRHWFWLFLLPVFGAFCIGFIWPFLQGVYLSFFKFRLVSNASFVGLSNYSNALADASFQHSFWYTAVTALVSLVFINVLAFAVAYILTQNIKGSNLFRTVFFMPNLIGGIVLGYIWSMIFDGILRAYNTSILLNSTYGFWGLIILMCWQHLLHDDHLHCGPSAVQDMLRRRNLMASRGEAVKVTYVRVPSITICVSCHLPLALSFLIKTCLDSGLHTSQSDCNDHNPRSGVISLTPSMLIDDLSRYSSAKAYLLILVAGLGLLTLYTRKRSAT
jgi:raffinose/stachyose/melibiose transport system permease protein